MKRIFLYLMGLIITSCMMDKPPLTQINSQTPIMTVQTDLTLLNKRITIPKGVKSATWIVVALGDYHNNSFPLGPTDTLLYAFLTFDHDNISRMKLLASDYTENTSSITIPNKVAQQIIPNIDLKELIHKGDMIEIKGKKYDPSYFNKGLHEGIYAVQIGKGLLIECSTR